MGKYLPVILFFLCSSFSFHANAGTDSLWNLANTTTGLQRITTLIKLATLYDNLDSLLIAENTYKKALDYLSSENKNNPAVIKLNLQAQLGLLEIFLFKTADYQKSVTLLLKALKIAQGVSDSSSLAKIYYYLSINYRFLLKYKQSLEFLNEAIPLTEAIKDTILNIVCLNEKANLMYYLNGHREGQVYRSKALKLAKLSNNLRAQGFINHDIGIFLMQEGKYREAIHHFLINMDFALGKNDARGITITALNIADIYLRIRKDDSVFYYLCLADSVSKKHSLIREQTDVFHQMTDLYVAKGNYKKAYEFLSRYANAKDTLFSIEKNKQIEELDAIYQNDKKQQQINIQQAELTRNELLIKQKNVISLLLGTGMLLFIILGVAILFNLRQKRHANKVLSAKNQDLLEQKKQIETQNEQLVNHRDHLESIVEERTRDLIKAKDKAEESDRLKTAFLQNISHEIRTPMNGIMGFLSLLKEPELTSEEQQLYFELIKQSSARMLNTVTDIMDLSKIEAALVQPRFAETNISDLTEKLYHLFKKEIEEKGMEFVLKNELHTNGEANIITDKEKLNTVLSHLLKNAVKYSQQGKIEFGYERKNDDLLFFVKDTGIGIPEERINAIFERFIQADMSPTRRHEGAGLGLTIAKAYIEMIGGKIWVESTLGSGSHFYFTIPYTLPQPTPGIPKEKKVQPVKPVKLKKLNILIAEDDELKALYFKTILTNISSSIRIARSGKETLSTLLQYPDTDLILMDIKMPDLDGYEAARQIRQSNQEIIIIAQTAYALAGDRENAIEAGCNDYITKPINKEHLIDILGRIPKFTEPG